MKFFKKVWVFLSFILISLVTLTSCDYESMYYDDNLLLNGVSGHTMVMSKTTTKTYNGFKEFNCTCKKLSGVYKCFDVIVNTNDTRTIDINFVLEDGKCKLVLIGKKDVYLISEGSYVGYYSLFFVEAGKYKFALVGIDAKYSLNVKMQI